MGSKKHLVNLTMTDRVAIAKYKGGPIVKVAEDREAMRDWYDEYGHETYEWENLRIQTGKIYRKD